MKTILMLVPGALLLLIAVGLGPRIAKDIRKKTQMPNTYAVLNVGTGKAMRVKDADPADGTAIIQYGHHNCERRFGA